MEKPPALSLEGRAPDRPRSLQQKDTSKLLLAVKE